MEPLLIDNKFLVKKLNSSYNGKELYLAFEYSAFLPKGAKNFRFLLNGEELATDKFDYFILERGIGDRVTGSIVARTSDTEAKSAL